MSFHHYCNCGAEVSRGPTGKQLAAIDPYLCPLCGSEQTDWVAVERFSPLADLFADIFERIEALEKTQQENSQT